MESFPVMRRFLQHRLALAGLTYLALITLVAIFATQLAPHDPNYIDPHVMNSHPSITHPLGLDPVGRDMLSRVIHASRISLSVGLAAVGINLTVGLLLGSIAGLYGGITDQVLSQFANTLLSLPQIMLILVIVAFAGPSIWNIILVMGLLGWPAIFRLVRGQILSLRSQDFIEAARALGASGQRLIRHHLLPNALGPILVAATLGTAAAILMEASLSFLGMGVQPPEASWGNLLTQAQSSTYIAEYPWLWVPPGALIFLTVLAINFVGDGLRDAFDPRMKR